MVKSSAPLQRGRALYRVLWGVVFALALALAGGTLYAYFRGSAAGDGRGPCTPPGSGRGAPAAASRAEGDESVFAGIGRIRVSTSGPDPAAVIVSIAFPYIAGDRAFSEELAARLPDLRRTTEDYFASHSSEELRRQSEPDIKDELLRRYNSILRLGRIERLFFSDYLVID